MSETQTLELQIKSSAEKAKVSVDSLVKSITNIENVLTNIYLELGKMETKATQSMNRINTAVVLTNNNTKKATDSIIKFGKAFSLGSAFIGIRRLTSQFLDWMEQAIDRTEQLNLFNVVFRNIRKNGVETFSEIGKSATKFQYKMNEAFGTNLTETLKYQGLFQSMGTNVGIPDKYAAIMSETMTKFTYDLASLYNKSESAVGEALRAGVYAGQTKPLRNFGIDVTQQSLKPIIKDLNLTNTNGELRTLTEMSQAEKEILRFVAALKQGKIAMGDFANTIESPANQLKVFKQQLVEAKVALTSLFIGVFSKILPYANAILMVIKEVSKAIASFFGIELKDYNSGIASSDAYVDSLDNIGDSADNAGKKVKELKREVLSFDQIHNIKEPKDTSSGSTGTTVSGGIDDRLLKALSSYDNGMDKIKMKATEIRDKIMEWLGFVKKINPLTGETYFEYQGIQKTLSNIWKTFKGIFTTNKKLVTLGLITLFNKLYSVGKKLVTAFGNSGLFKIIKSLYQPTVSLFSYMLTGLKASHATISSGIEAWRVQSGIINETTGKLDGFKGAMNGAKIAIQGLITGAIGLYSVYESMKSLSTEGLNLFNSLGLVAGGISAIASGVQIGAIFGPWGAVIGGAVGALSTLVSAMYGYQTEAEKMASSVDKTTESTKQYLKSIDEQKEAIQEQLNANLTMTGVHKNLVSELESITSANGKVKKGYEVKEYSMTDGLISGYDEYIKKIKETIKAKEAEYILEANRQDYINALQNEVQLYAEKEKQLKALEKAQKAQNKAQEEYNQAYEEWVIATGNGMNIDIMASINLNKKRSALEKTNKTLKEAQKTSDEATKKYQENILTQQKYSELQTGFMTGNMKEIEKSIKEYTNTYIKNGKLIKETDEENTKRIAENWQILLKNYKETNNKMYDELLNTLVKETKAVDKITPEQVEKWAKLGKSDEEAFINSFKKLPKNIQQEVVDKMYEKGYSISEKLQKGLKKNNVQIDIKTKVQDTTVKIDADVSSAKNKTESWLKNILKGVGTLLGVRINANGGIFENGNWSNIKQFANGGIPSHGSMFIAGERGSEIVGNINGRTEVLNKSQIASAIYSAMMSAMSNFNGQAIQVQLDLHTDEGVVIDRINQKTKQSGICPIEIPY